MDVPISSGVNIDDDPVAMVSVSMRWKLDNAHHACLT